MGHQDNSKTKIWIYAVILFTSAFIVLLITAYSQIKFNKNIDEYKRQIFNNENEKSKYLINLNSALDENIRLKEEIESLKKDYELLKDRLNSQEHEISRLKDDFAVKTSTYEALLQAMTDYRKGNMAACAEKLVHSINPALLNGEALEEYNFLLADTPKKAARQLFNEGYNYFKKKNYSQARENFVKSIEFADGEYFSDDCYYYLAYTEYLLGENDRAIECLNTLLERYPSTNCKKYAEDLKKRIGS